MSPHPQTFPSISKCDASGREAQTSIATDLEGTLLISPSPFPYFFLIAVEAGCFLRGAILLLIAPITYLVHHYLSESLALKLMIYVSTAGLRIRDVELASRAVLPRFYAGDVRKESWRVFSGCGGRRVVLTAMPRVIVEPFATEFLGAEKVIGTEIEVNEGRGTATGFVEEPGVMVGELKEAAVLAEFGEDLPDLGLGDTESDHHFLALCKEGYMVDHDLPARPLPLELLNKPVIFHDGRLVQRPTPFNALVIFLWMPIAIPLAILRTYLLLGILNIYINLPFTISTPLFICGLFGTKIVIKGNGVPRPLSPKSLGNLYVCNHSTMLDPIMIAGALQSKVSCVTYSLGRLSELLSPLSTVPLTRNREADAARIAALLQDGDVVICPEGTTCREPFLLRFSALFAELSDRIVPVAVEGKMNMFYGSTVRGWKSLDPYFFFMNPKPQYHVTFLEALPWEMTCQGGKSAIDVANHVQRLLGATLGFECTSLTRKDKYMTLAGYDGSVSSKNKDI